MEVALQSSSRSPARTLDAMKEPNTVMFSQSLSARPSLLPLKLQRSKVASSEPSISRENAIPFRKVMPSIWRPLVRTITPPVPPIDPAPEMRLFSMWSWEPFSARNE
jgi:hypothetical protein